jgi:hypothetical protein
LDIDPPIELLIDDKMCAISKIENDVTDHSLILLAGCSFSAKARLGIQPSVGAQVMYWGNPYLFEDMLRIGYIAKKENGSLFLDINGYKGDSGSAVFDSSGKIVGVLSYGYTIRAFTIAEATPFTFTRKQYDIMGVSPPSP